MVSCSALKRVYRERILRGAEDVRIVFLADDHDFVAARIAAGRDHFMPTSLLKSQFATLEVPHADENVLAVSNAEAPAEVVAGVRRKLGV